MTLHASKQKTLIVVVQRTLTNALDSPETSLHARLTHDGQNRSRLSFLKNYVRCTYFTCNINKSYSLFIDSFHWTRLISELHFKQIGLGLLLFSESRNSRCISIIKVLQDQYSSMVITEWMKSTYQDHFHPRRCNSSIGWFNSMDDPFFDRNHTTHRSWYLFKVVMCLNTVLFGF